MPLLKLPQLTTKCPSDAPRVSVWHATETARDLFEKLPPHWNKPAEALNIYKNEARKKEVLAEHLLLLEALGENIELKHTASGQPILKGSELHCSISHSHGYVAIGLSPAPLGLDIEVWGPKAFKLRERFLSKEEMISTPADAERHAVRLWTAKEAVYKHFNSSKLANFLDTIRIEQTPTGWKGTALPLQQSARLQFVECEPFALCFTTTL